MRRLIALALIVMAPLAAHAQQHDHSGLYFGAQVGPQVGHNTLDLNVPGTSIAEIDGLSMRDVHYGAHIGGKWQVPQTRWVLGVEGGYLRGEAEFTLSVLSTNIVNASIEPTWYVDGTIGYAFGKWLPYVGVGYQRADLDVSILGTNVLSRELSGWRGIVGMEYAFDKVTSLGLQYTYAKYGTEDLLSNACGGPCGVKLDLDSETHFVGLRLNFRPAGLF